MEVNKYLEETEIINYSDKNIQELSNSIRSKSNNEIEYIKNCYEFVRDKISHSADILDSKKVTCTASEVLQYKEGTCFAKAHLLAALLRAKGILTGFIYQKIILDDKLKPYLVLHGLNSVYIRELNKWIKLDARGNKEGVNAQFSLDDEKLAFKIRKELGEELIEEKFSSPSNNVIYALKHNTTREELWVNLPGEV